MQPEAAALNLARDGFAPAIKRLEDVLAVLGGDAEPAILNGDARRVMLQRRRRHANPARLAAVLDGVADQILNRRSQRRGISDDALHSSRIGRQIQQLRRDRDLERRAGVLDLVAARGHCVLDQRGHRNRRPAPPTRGPRRCRQAAARARPFRPAGAPRLESWRRISSPAPARRRPRRQDCRPRRRSPTQACAARATRPPRTRAAGARADRRGAPRRRSIRSRWRAAPGSPSSARNYASVRCSPLLRAIRRDVSPPAASAPHSALMTSRRHCARPGAPFFEDIDDHTILGPAWRRGSPPRPPGCHAGHRRAPRTTSGQDAPREASCSHPAAPWPMRLRLQRIRRQRCDGLSRETTAIR